MRLDAEAQASARRGIAAFALLSIGGMLLLTVLFHAAGGSLHSTAGTAVVLLGMALPSVARVIVVRFVDTGFAAPLPLRDGKRPRLQVLLVPLLLVVAIYGVAYGGAALAGVSRAAPVWNGAGKIAANVLVNGVLVSIPGFIGAFGEEWGWRGYLQPRLDQLGVPFSPWVLAGVAVMYHAPFIVALGYVNAGGVLVSLGLFALLELGLAPTWTYVTYRLRSVWAAVWIHTLHNTFSQVLFPKSLGVGDERLLGESGLLPCAGYLLVAGACVLAARRRSKTFQAFLRDSVR
ncbi:MAG TPA: CPBP family intramembrane metalloprotease [Polyangiaceae bacterium]|nr:CPBP family intramembrane metalloprotease [Polyangiaceae bacterium]